MFPTEHCFVKYTIKKIGQHACTIVSSALFHRVTPRFAVVGSKAFLKKYLGKALKGSES